MQLFEQQYRKLLNCYKSSSANLHSRRNLLENAGTTGTAADWPRERVQRLLAGLRTEIASRSAYFGYLIQQTPIIVVDPQDRSCPTMQVNGAGNLYINPEFVRTLFNADMDGVVYNKDIEELNAAKGEAESYTVLSPGDKMFIGIIVHELWHIYKDHIIRMGDKTKMVSFGGMTCTLWNIATDLEINDILLHKWGYYLLKGCITPEPNGDWEMNGTTINVRGRSPERIYYELEKLLPPPPPKEDPRDIKAGDIIFDKKTGKYGEVVTITNGKARIAELTEQEAKSRV